MNDIIYQIEERIYDLDTPDNKTIVRNLLLLEIETYCRIALALAMDEVTRPDNYLRIADMDKLKECQEEVREYFKFTASTHTLGRQLTLAENLLKVFPAGEKDCPAHILWIRKLISTIRNTLLPPRNTDAHELSIDPAYLRSVMNKVRDNVDGNPYLDEDRVSILVPRPDKSHNSRYIMDVMNFQRRAPEFSLRQLLRISPEDDEEAARSGPNASITAPIALHRNAVYLNVMLPDGTQRLHLLSPLLAHFTGREYGIYFKRQNSVFRTSLYLSFSDRGTREEIPTWDDQLTMLIGRTDRLQQIRWDGPLFESEDQNNKMHNSMKVSQTTDGSNLTYFLNVRRDRMHQTYPELWHAIWGDNRDSAHMDYFNVDVYDMATLDSLHRMFRSDRAPIANPLQVCGQGGVGKTHTVINALFNKFIHAKVIDADCMKFKYVIFLTAKRTMFNTDKEGPNYEAWDNPDFQTCDSALLKILRIITDGRSTNVTSRPDGREDSDEKVPPLVRQILNCLGADPMLLIIDDLDSVCSPDKSLTGEAKRNADRDEQCRLVEALIHLTAQNDNCRVIITTRRPLDEVRKLELKPLLPDIALRFGSAYYHRYRPGEFLPKFYSDAIKKIGSGVPAFIMRIIYLLNRSTSSSLDEAQLKKLQHDIADFSLNTTTLNAVGIMIFSILAQMSNALDALPLGLLRIVLYDQPLESITDAIDDMKVWSMIEYRNNKERIALQNDSLILWSQLDESARLDQRHQRVINALRQDHDRWLLDYTVRPGVLMNKVFEALEPDMSDDEKHAFGERIQGLIEDRENPEMFFQGMQNNPAEQKIVAWWISTFQNSGGVKQPPKRVEAAPAKPAVIEVPVVEAPVPEVRGTDPNRLLDDLKRGTWDLSKANALITALGAMDFSVAETQDLFLRVIQFLPEALKNAVSENRCSADDADHLATVLDSICGLYDEQTGERSSEKYLEPFIVW